MEEVRMALDLQDIFWINWLSGVADECELITEGARIGALVDEIEDITDEILTGAKFNPWIVLEWCYDRCLRGLPGFRPGYKLDRKDI